MVNVPLNLNLTVDFRKNITITNRNGSKRIRTFGGDHVLVRPIVQESLRLAFGC